MTDPAPLTLGIHHLGLTVPDLAPTRDFLIGALGFRIIGENADYPAVFLSDGALTLTLWQAAPDAAAFDRRGNIGLHHFALKVADATVLDAVFARVSAWPGFALEFAPEPPRPGTAARHFIGAIPGGARVEFFANAPT